MVVFYQTHVLFVDYLSSGLLFPATYLFYLRRGVFPVNINLYLVRIFHSLHHHFFDCNTSMVTL